MVALIVHPSVMWDAVSAHLAKPTASRLSSYNLLAQLGDNWESQEHLSFSFFVQMTDSHFPNFHVTRTAPGCYVVSGTFSAFHRWILDSLLMKANKERRMLATAMLVIFEGAGLKPVFNRYRKKALADGTITLEHL